MTNTSTCTGTPGQDANIFNTWRAQFQGDQYNYTLVFQINPGATTVTKTCYYSTGMQVSALTTVSSVVQGTQYTIYTSGQGSNSKTDAQGVQYDCSISVQPEIATFGLVGNCLTLTNGPQTSYLVP